MTVVFDTDPVSVLTTVGCLGVGGGPHHAVIDVPFPPIGLIDLSTLLMMGGIPYRRACATNGASRGTTP